MLASSTSLQLLILFSVTHDSFLSLLSSLHHYLRLHYCSLRDSHCHHRYRALFSSFSIVHRRLSPSSSSWHPSSRLSLFLFSLLTVASLPLFLFAHCDSITLSFR
ncbi:hypothetical protein AAHE18_03G369100 [Arachis hypogaea]